jgi:hypothetical protein
VGNLSEKEVYMKDAPVTRMGELFGKLYYHLAKEMMSFGDEGENALRRAIRNFAIDRGETMRRQAEALGLPLTYKTYREIADMPNTQPGYKKYHPEVTGTQPSNGLCTYAEIWKRYQDGCKLGKIYCDEFHHAKWAAFNPKFKIDMVNVITKGDPYCNLVSYIEGDEYDLERQKIIEEICKKAKKFGFIVDTSPSGDLKKACARVR